MILLISTRTYYTYARMIRHSIPFHSLRLNEPLFSASLAQPTSRLCDSGKRHSPFLSLSLLPICLAFRVGPFFLLLCAVGSFDDRELRLEGGRVRVRGSKLRHFLPCRIFPTFSLSLLLQVRRCCKLFSGGQISEVHAGRRENMESDSYFSITLRDPAGSVDMVGRFFFPSFILLSLGGRTWGRKCAR